MIRRSFTALILAMALPIAFVYAQSASTKQLKVKSQKEGEAIQAIFASQDPDARIAAAMNLVTKFSETDYKGLAFYLAGFSAMQKGDLANAIVYSEKSLEADPKNFGSMFQIASALAQTTKEFDLDKEEKLARAEKLAKEGIELVKTAPKPNPQLTDEQWEAGKRDYQAQGYEAMGLAAMVRKNYPACVEQFTLATTNAAQQDPSAMVRLGVCQRHTGKFDEAIATFDKALADPNSGPAVKKAATDEKLIAAKLKAEKK